MGIGVVLAGIVTVLRNGLMGSDLLKKDFKIVMQPGFIIIDEN